ncbi:MAG: polyprenyl diphosphate synthase [Candidatus Methylarchaceae archaeon HK02M2]|nr:polyprenyl diphosphate synthase [Candidatus Methylarchaceae archaeon HK01M]MCP8323121.1 polyprenyl diphosphate synthase [Candidatus Methylarchaceae archaeon HK02M2]
MIVGLIPDGNRRYAEKYGISRAEVFRKGVETLGMFLDFCFRNDVSHVIVYALSEDNLKRPKKKLEEVFDLYEKEFRKYLDSNSEVHQKQINFQFYSTQREVLPVSLREVMDQLTEATKAYTRHCVVFLMAWSAQHEFLNACLKAFREPESEMKSLLMVDVEPDLIIRTGNLQRLSDFLSIQARYSELYFIEKLFPECIEQDCETAFSWYHAQERKFGR